MVDTNVKTQSTSQHGDWDPSSQVAIIFRTITSLQNCSLFWGKSSLLTKWQNGILERIVKISSNFTSKHQSSGICDQRQLNWAKEVSTLYKNGKSTNCFPVFPMWSIRNFFVDDNTHTLVPIWYLPFKTIGLEVKQKPHGTQLRTWRESPMHNLPQWQRPLYWKLSILQG